MTEDPGPATPLPKRAATRKRISAAHTEKNVAGPGGEVEVEAEAGTAL